MEENQIVADGVKKYVRFSNGESDVIDYGHRMYELIGKGERYKWKWILNRYHEVFHEKRNSTHIKDRHRHMEESGELKASYPADYDPPAGVLSLQTIRNDIRALAEEEYEFDFLRQEAEQMIVQLEKLAAQLEAEQAQAHDQHHPHLQALQQTQEAGNPAAQITLEDQRQELAQHSSMTAGSSINSSDALKSCVQKLQNKQGLIAEEMDKFFETQKSKISSVDALGLDVSQLSYRQAALHAVFDMFLEDLQGAKMFLEPAGSGSWNVSLAKLRQKQVSVSRMVVEFFKTQQKLVSELEGGPHGFDLSGVQYGAVATGAVLDRFFTELSGLFDEIEKLIG